VNQRPGARPLVQVVVEEPVATVVLTRPERHNALVPELLDDLRSAIAELAAAEGVRAIVLAAEGRSFSTGGDVAAFAAHEGEELAAYACGIVGGLHAAVLDLLGLDIPVVAAVHGPVTGGSLGLVLASDVVVCGPGASFAPWYVRVGFSPDGGWTALLPRRVGHARAAAWQLLNRTVDAEAALAAGLVDEVHEQPRARALELAHHAGAMQPGAVARTKRLLRRDLADVREALDAELESFVEQIRSDEARAGMAAFLDADRRR
jgi:2-(1,2-epoxy-1,2-dihydrophenyl)acetyl-CoA isomerase